VHIHSRDSPALLVEINGEAADGPATDAHEMDFRKGSRFHGWLQKKRPRDWETILRPL
jgi:hypothetical protein